VTKTDRTGVGSKFLSGETLEWDMSNGFPIITTRKTTLRIAFEETMFFLRGETDTKILEAKNINIWKGNTSRKFLDDSYLAHLPEGSIGTGYSHQWRNFGGDIDIPNGIDQVKNMLRNIEANPFDRRHVITAWNPLQLGETPLPPCHLMHMYSVDPDKNALNSCFIMRSNDIPFGLPFNIMGYALLNHLFAKHLGYNPGKLVYFGWDAHIYLNQIDMCNEQLTREPRPLPDLIIHKDISTFDELLKLEYTDVELVGYLPHPDIKNKPKMAI